MKLTTTIAAASLAALVTAAPSRTVAKRADSCGQWDSVQTGDYTVYNDLWGEDDADSGSGCFGIDSVSGSTIAWHATWTWEGGSSIKSFPNAVVSSDDFTLSDISSMESTWDWTYTGSDIVADVAYDIFTSSTAGGSNEYEIMIWLAAIGGAGPISSSYGSDGSPTAIATVTIAGYSWNLYSGSNGVNAVFSFLPASGDEITSFSGDVYDFFSYLISDQGLPSSQYLISAGAGTGRPSTSFFDMRSDADLDSEPTTGEDAVFTVSSYSMTIT